MAELNKTNKIRVATFNIGDYSTANGSSGDGIPLGNGTEVTKEEYVALFKKVNADLWGLQEDSEFFNGTTKETAYDAIYKKVLPFYKRNFAWTYNGKAFLSNKELFDVEPVKYPPAVTSYAPDGTNGYGHGWFLKGKIRVDGKDISIVSLHFDWNCKERRAVQIESVIEFAKSQKYCIIIGDFNPEDYVNGTKLESGRINEGSINVYQEDWKKFSDAGFEHANGGKFGAFATLMKKGQARDPHPWDNIVVTPNITITDAKVVVEPWMDDHAIIVAELEIN